MCYPATQRVVSCLLHHTHCISSYQREHPSGTQCSNVYNIILLLHITLVTCSCSYVIRAHRDDQSAFTFLISRFFGYGKKRGTNSSSRNIFLDSYTWVKYTKQSSPSRLVKQAVNCSNHSKSSPIPSSFRMT